jgi:hypothetical protein
MADQWHHCRACGEEGLTRETASCPLCGIEEPVQLCHACRLPVREAQPWQITARSNDAPDAPPLPFSFHKACYAGGKRRMRRDYPSPDWRLELDERDDSEPLSRTRKLAGTACLMVGALLVLWLISQSPRPEPVFSPMVWDEMARKTAPEAPWVRIWFHHRPPHVTFMGLALTVAGIALGLWFIRWGLSRPRALFLDGLFERDER